MSSLFSLQSFSQIESKDRRITEQITSLKKNLSHYRYQHSLDVAALALRLCEQRFAHNTLLHGKVLHAALLHDYTKEWKESEHLAFAKEHGLATKLSSVPFALHHAVTAAKASEVIFGHKDKDIQAAIYYHTSGFCPLSAVAKVIYCADYLASAEVPWKKIKDASWQELMFWKASHTVQKLSKLQEPIHPYTYELYQCLSEFLRDKKLKTNKQ